MDIGCRSLSSFEILRNRLFSRLLARDVKALTTTGVVSLRAISRSKVEMHTDTNTSSFGHRRALRFGLRLTRVLITSLGRRIRGTSKTYGAEVRTTRLETTRRGREGVGETLTRLRSVEGGGVGTKGGRRERMGRRSLGGTETSVASPSTEMVGVPSRNFQPTCGIRCIAAGVKGTVVNMSIAGDKSSRGRALQVVRRIRGQCGLIPGG